MARRVLIDCDPGVDDAIALALAAVSDELHIPAVTTVAGNQTLEKTTHNARGMLARCGRDDIPVVHGMHRPLVRSLTPASEVHGDSGMASLSFPETEHSVGDRHAIDTIESEAAEGDLTVVALGPLTNLAAAFLRHPELAASLDEIVVMGGSIAGGNVTPAAEFNIHTDPEAAQIVFDAPVPVTMVGLDVTRAARVGPSFQSELQAIQHDVTDALDELIDHLVSVHERRYGWSTAPIHDALAVATVLDETLVMTESMRVDVECQGTHTTGMTVCDQLGSTDKEANVRVATTVDDDGFRALLLDRFHRYLDL